MLYESVVPSHSLELLKLLSPQLAKHGFYLAGGTALALRLGHRESIDLDFFSAIPFEPDRIVSELAKLTGQLPRIFQKTEGSLSMTLCETKVELLLYQYPELAFVDRINGITLASLADNGAMKLSALTARGSKKDFIDVSALLQVTSLPEMTDWFERKYPNAGSFMLYKSLTWFEDAEEEPDPKILNGESWEEVKRKIVRQLAK